MSELIAVITMPNSGLYESSTAKVTRWGAQEGDLLPKSALVANIELSNGLWAKAILSQKTIQKFLKCDTVIRRLLVELDVLHPVGTPIAVIADRNVTESEIDVAVAKAKEEFASSQQELAKLEKPHSQIHIFEMRQLLAPYYANDPDFSIQEHLLVSQWLCEEGTLLKKGQPFAEFEFMKSCGQFEAPFDCQLRRKLAETEKWIEAKCPIAVLATEDVTDDDIDIQIAIANQEFDQFIKRCHFLLDQERMTNSITIIPVPESRLLKSDKVHLASWHAEIGDTIESNQKIARLGSQSTYSNVTGAKGVLRRRLVDEGTECFPGCPMAVVSDPGVLESEIDVTVYMAQEKFKQNQKRLARQIQKTRIHVIQPANLFQDPESANIDEIYLSQWFFEEGDWVKAQEPIAEIELAKSTHEIPAPADLQFRRMLVKADETSPLNRPIGVFAAEGVTDKEIDDAIELVD